jgi:hypothetical protein
VVALLAANTGEGGTVTENPFAKGRLNVELKKARSVTECSNLMAQFGYQDGMVVSGFEAADLKIIVKQSTQRTTMCTHLGPRGGGGGEWGAHAAKRSRVVSSKEEEDAT